MKQKKILQLFLERVKGLFSHHDGVAFLFFIVLGVMVINDAQARILITDPAYYLFNIINDSKFFISGARYTAVINQILVLFAVKLNVSLRILIPLYSLSFVLVRFLYYVLVTKVLKNQTAGFAIIAFTMIGVAESYFRPTSESTIALLNGALFFAFLFYCEKKDWGKWKNIIQIIGSILFVVFGYFSHPIALFSLFFVILYFSISAGKLKTFYPYVGILLVLIVFMGKVLLGANNQHHDSLYGNLFHSPVAIAKELPTYYPYKFFSGHFKQLYRALVVLLICSVLLLQVKKEKRLAGLFVLVYSFVYFVVACTSFKKGDANMQMEKIFIPLVFFAAIGFADGICHVFRKKKIILSITIVLISFLGIYRITKTRTIYQGRIDYLKEIIAEAQKVESRKLLIRSDQTARKLQFTWAMGIETLMLTSMNDAEPLTVYCIQHNENLEGKKDKADNFIAAHFRTSYSYSQMNEKYFVLPDEIYTVWDKDFK
nr:hypothetical protein [uncultured Draconibacterium sp.]